MRRWMQIFAMAGMAMLVAACQWGHVGFSPARTRYHPFEKAIRNDNVDQLQERWSVPLDTEVGDPVVSGRFVYINAYRNDLATFHALDAGTGSSRWSVEDEPISPGNPVQRFPGAVAGDLVYAGFGQLVGSQSDGELDAFDAASGEPVWSRSTAVYPGRILSPPAVADGTVYATFSYVCCAGAAVGGFASWDAATGEPGFIGGYGPGSSVAVAGGRVFQAGSGQLGAFDANGEQNCANQRCGPVWQGAIGSNATPDSSPAVANGVVYVGSDDNKLYAFDADGCGAATCAPLWSATTGGDIDSSPAVANGVVYVGADDDKLYAFDADGCGVATCAPLWIGTSGGDIDSSPAVANGLVYVGSDDNKLYVFDADDCGTATCPSLRTLTTGGDIDSSPAVGNKMIYVGSDDGRLHAFGLPS